MGIVENAENISASVVSIARIIEARFKFLEKTIWGLSQELKELKKSGGFGK